MTRAAIAMGCRHAEAFCLMIYAGPSGSLEVFWNARDGVTPYGGCPSRSGDEELTHAFFGSDLFSPRHRPKVGDRIFISQTRAGAALRRRAWLTERWAAHTEWDVLLRERFATVEEAIEALDDWTPGTPTLSLVGPDSRLGPWFDGDRWCACVAAPGDQLVRGFVALRKLGGGGYVDHDQALRAYCDATGEPSP